ncbi:MAG: AraC family transcriptional regulator [Bacteroidota bacterium]
MRTKIYGAELEELVIEVNYPDSFATSGAAYYEKEYTTAAFLGAGCYKETFFEGIHIGYGDFLLTEPTLAYFDTDMETVEMHFALGGLSRGCSPNFPQELSFEANQHNLIYACGFQGSIEWCAEESMKLLEINMQPSFLKKYLPNGYLFDLFLESIERKQSTVISPHNYPITPQMMNLIQGIIHCDRTGHFKRMFLESSIIELLMLQLEQIANHDCKVFCAIDKQHQERLHAAREILNQQLNANFTLNSLAQQVGTNEFALKKGFKELFGTTVFGYWNQIKMQEARTLLTEGMMNITEISSKIGYKNPQHFSTAFKKHFGYSPSELKTRESFIKNY